MREIRFSIDRDWARAAHGDSGFERALPVTNSWGGWPSAVGVAPYLILRIVVSGDILSVGGGIIEELDSRDRARDFRHPPTRMVLWARSLCSASAGS